MAQNYTEDTYSGTNTGATDLQNIENNFAVIKSLWSGTTAPSIGVVAGTPWFDTSKKVLKYRNQANSAWLGIMHGDVNQKILVYRDSAMDGWAVDSSVTDKVVGIKGGATYVTGGIDSQGTWTTDHQHTGAVHTHTGGSYYVNTYHRHGLGWSTTGTQFSDKTAYEGDNPYYSDYQGSTSDQVNGTSSASSAANTGTAGGSSWRPAAACCTLQALDI